MREKIERVVNLITENVETLYHSSNSRIVSPSLTHRTRGKQLGAFYCTSNLQDAYSWARGYNYRYIHRVLISPDVFFIEVDHPYTMPPTHEDDLIVHSKVREAKAQGFIRRFTNFPIEEEIGIIDLNVIKDIDLYDELF